MIALSYSGETAELLTLLPHLKRRGVHLISITGKVNSTLAKASDCVIDIHVTREACPLNLAPTSSTTNTLVIGDALAMVLMEARGLTKDHFAELHPSGSLGRALLLRATDIMRTGDDFVVVNPEVPVLFTSWGGRRYRPGWETSRYFHPGRLRPVFPERRYEHWRKTGWVGND